MLLQKNNWDEGSTLQFYRDNCKSMPASYYV
jgi:hypothetical protein